MKKVLIITLLALVSCIKEECDGYNHKLDELHGAIYQAEFNHSIQPTQNNQNKIDLLEQSLIQTEKQRNIRCK
jgi:hypothetical protein